MGSSTSQSDLAIVRHFSNLEDPRIKRSRKHKLTDIIAVSICAIISGVDSIEGIEEFADAKLDWLKQFLELPGGVPSHDTISRVLARVSPSGFEDCFMAWMNEVASLTEGDIISIDGKTLRRSFDKAAGLAPIHMVSAWANSNGVVLGQVATDEKSNEITAIPALLKALAIKGCIVTIDAMGCQREICSQIVESKADYCINLKGNQGTLHSDVQTLFDTFSPTQSKPGPFKHMVTREKRHGREERRDYFITNDIEWIQSEHNWPGLQSVGIVKSTRIVGGEVSYEERYFITSFAADAELFAKAVRQHWQVENGLHWSLDVLLREDESRVRKDNSAENFSRLRRMALNLLRKIPEKKSVPKKRIRCALDDDYRAKALVGQGL